MESKLIKSINEDVKSISEKKFLYNPDAIYSIPPLKESVKSSEIDMSEVYINPTP
jgi:hypothetical protein